MTPQQIFERRVYAALQTIIPTPFHSRLADFIIPKFPSQITNAGSFIVFSSSFFLTNFVFFTSLHH